MISGSISTLRGRGEAAALAALPEHARKLIRAPDLLGIDLTKVALSRKGIARRSGD